MAIKIHASAPVADLTTSPIVELFTPAIGPEDELDNSTNTEDSFCPEMDDASSEVDIESEDLNVKYYDLILAFLAINSSPSDAEFHMLATACKITPEVLEESLFRVMAIMAEDDELSEEARELIQETLNAEYLPNEGEPDGAPDIGIDEIDELTRHDGDPRP
jgi:hypothetical protein